MAANMTDTQTRLATIWASVLPNRSARMFIPESNFFDEGGHSILAQQMFFARYKRMEGHQPAHQSNIPVPDPRGPCHRDRSLPKTPLGYVLTRCLFLGRQNVEDEAYAVVQETSYANFPSPFPAAEQTGTSQPPAYECS